MKSKAPLTLQQVKDDIKSLKSHRIYYSSQSLWWTHLDSDVRDATETGTAFILATIDEKLQDPYVTTERKTYLEEFKKRLLNPSEPQVPSDPTGTPLYQMDDCEKWISAAEDKPAHFGKHGLEAFIKSHHQNSPPLKSWDEYNQAIDDLLNETE